MELAKDGDICDGDLRAHPKSLRRTTFFKLIQEPVKTFPTVRWPRPPDLSGLKVGDHIGAQAVGDEPL